MGHGQESSLGPLWVPALGANNLKKMSQNEILARLHIQDLSASSIKPKVCLPLTMDISCDARRFFASGASRSRLECTRQRPTQQSRTSMIAHKKIRINDKNQRRRGASPFVHEVYFKLSTADSEQVIVQGHGPTAQGHRKGDSSLVGPPDKTWKIRKSPLRSRGSKSYFYALSNFFLSCLGC
jgi:hypothetical protein